MKHLILNLSPLNDRSEMTGVDGYRTFPLNLYSKYQENMA